MSRAVYIGGFGNGKKSAAGVGEVLADLHGDTDVFTFSYARKNPDTVAKAVNGVPVYTHSAGIMPLVGLYPEYIKAFSPPLPKTRLKYVGQAVKKSINMMSKEKTMGATMGDVTRYNASAISELVSHPVANFMPLLTKEISEFDAITTAISARNAGVRIGLVYSEKDEFFQVSQNQIDQAAINLLPIHTVSGVHDQLVLTPSETIEAYHRQLR